MLTFVRAQICASFSLLETKSLSSAMVAPHDLRSTASRRRKKLGYFRQRTEDMVNSIHTPPKNVNIGLRQF